MNVTVTPAPRSSISVRVELPPEKLDSAIAEAVRHLSQRTKIHGFRPGKAPRAVVERVVGSEAVLEEAMDHLVQRAYRDALVEHQILPLAQAEVKVEQGEEGKPVIFTATVPIRPDVQLGDYRSFKFGPEIEAIDDAEGPEGHRRAARPEREPRAGRGPRAPGTVTTRSSATPALATASRSRAARPSGCR